MDKQQIFNEIKVAMFKLFEIPEDSISLDTRLFEDLELDSIDAVDLIVHLQKIIKQKVNPEDFKAVRTVGDVVNAIDNVIHTP